MTAKKEKANRNKAAHFLKPGLARADSRGSNEIFVCYCNRVSKEPIEAAIRRGCNTPLKIFDATNAGVGACGGSCRPYLQKMLDCYTATGDFPTEPRRDRPKTAK